MSDFKSIPFKDLIHLQERMSRVFDEALDRYSGFDGSPDGSWAPVADIFETTDLIIIKAEISGVNIEDIDVKVNKNILTIRGERKQSRDLAKEYCHRMESPFGLFQRVFSLPEEISGEDIEANLSNGVLEIRAPKLNIDDSLKVKIEEK